MLTADLVRARVRKGELTIRSLDAATIERLRPAVEHYVGVLTHGIGHTLAEIEEALAETDVAARDQKLADGLGKLLLDRCTFAMDEGIDPPALREALFTRAAAARRACGPDEALDRGAVLAAVAEETGLSVDAIEAGLYADLKQNQKLQSFDAIDADALIAGYDLEQAKAVLLRATRLVVDVDFADADAARQFFRRLKFRRLLYRLARRPDGRYHIEIDGPFGLFQSSTRYGLQLALMLPALYETSAFALEADVMWFKGGDAVKLRLEGGAGASASKARARLPDDVQQLVDRFRALDCGWTVRRARKIVDLPGVGLCVPDLVFKHAETGQRVYLEVMGYWSRDAVWKRVELVEQGLSTPIIFALSSRLRVSEKALGKALPGELYVYKGVMSARGIADRLDARLSRG